MNELAVLIGLVSFPGLIATMLCDALVVHVERWRVFKYIVYTFTFGIASYVFLQVAVWLASLCGLQWPFLTNTVTLTLWGALVTGKGLHFSEVAWASVFAPVIALLMVVAGNKKLVHRLAQWARISNKYGDENLFSYFLNSPDVSWVYVRDRSAGLTYFGLVRAYSETKEVQELLLINVSVYGYLESDHFYDVDSIYLSKPLGSFVIEQPNSGNKEITNGNKENDPAP